MKSFPACEKFCAQTDYCLKYAPLMRINTIIIIMEKYDENIITNVLKLFFFVSGNFQNFYTT